jgi:amino acid adenylation domain-containing protein
VSIVEHRSTTWAYQLSPENGSGGAWLHTGTRQGLPYQSAWEMILAGLRQTGSNTAICGDGFSLSGDTVLQGALSLASALERGPVGVLMPRGPEQVLAAIAAMQPGAQYVPVGYDLPPSKREAILGLDWLTQVVTCERTPPPGFELWREPGVLNSTLFVHRRKQPRGDVLDASDCYVAFTSGTTGAPKGCRNTQRGLINRLATLRRHLGINADDRILYKASSAFDVHIWEMLLPLTMGAVLVIYPHGDAFLDLDYIASFVEAHRVTTMVAVPSLLHGLLETPAFVTSRSLTKVICGGEKWGPDLADKFYAALPLAQLFNGYGPTEAAIGVCNWPVRKDRNGRIELGPPLPNNSFLIHTPSESSTEGELVISGEQVGQGYVGDPNSDRFYREPITGDWAYRTGDRVEVNAETGALYFLGRIDTQIKLNGLRLELSDIETCVAAIAGVSHCAAFDLRETSIRTLAVCYSSRTGLPLETRELKHGLENNLWAGVTAGLRFFHFKSLPLLASGKVARPALRKILAPPTGAATQRSSAEEEPVTGAAAANTEPCP